MAGSLRKRRRPGEAVIRGLLFIAAALSILTTVGIVFELGNEALLFFRSQEASLAEFLSSTHWQPAILDFGIWPLVLSTLTTSVTAMVVALPVGLATAIYLSEYATPRVRGTIKPVLEILAGIPTVVYGYFALTFMTPLLRSILGVSLVEIFNTSGIRRNRGGHPHHPAGELDVRGRSPRGTDVGSGRLRSRSEPPSWRPRFGWCCPALYPASRRPSWCRSPGASARPWWWRSRPAQAQELHIRRGQPVRLHPQPVRGGRDHDRDTSSGLAAVT